MKAILLEGTVKERVPSSQELAEAVSLAEQRLKLGDRAGAYLELYKVTGNELLLTQAQITTYSGTFGGMAIEGNYQAKIANPDKYDLTLDKFSHEIDQAVVELAKNLARDKMPQEFTTFNILQTDKAVWASHQMSKDFPGNGMYVGRDNTIANTDGGIQAILAMDEMELGRRPAEYANNPNYAIHTSKDDRFVTVVNKATQRIECFFDKALDSDVGTTLNSAMTPDLEQVNNTVPEGRILAERQLKMQFLQAGTLAPEESLPAFNASNPIPPAHVDRVFAYAGKLYQIDDRRALEAEDVDFHKLVQGNQLEAANYYLDGLQYGGKSASNFVASVNTFTSATQNPKSTTAEFSKAMLENQFNDLSKAGVIKPLTPSEQQAYQQMLDSLDRQGLPSPYQSADEAFNQLRKNIVDMPPSMLKTIDKFVENERTPESVPTTLSFEGKFRRQQLSALHPESVIEFDGMRLQGKAEYQPITEDYHLTMHDDHGEEKTFRVYQYKDDVWISRAKEGTVPDSFIEIKNVRLSTDTPVFGIQVDRKPAMPANVIETTVPANTQEMTVAPTQTVPTNSNNRVFETTPSASFSSSAVNDPSLTEKEILLAELRMKMKEYGMTNDKVSSPLLDPAAAERARLQADYAAMKAELEEDGEKLTSADDLLMTKKGIEFG